MSTLDYEKNLRHYKKGIELMKRIITIITLTLALILILSSCGNKQLIDTTYTFDQAIIAFPDGTCKTIDIDSWKDYDDGEQIQIKDKGGNVYLVSSYNCVLVSTK